MPKRRKPRCVELDVHRRGAVVVHEDDCLSVRHGSRATRGDCDADGGLRDARASAVFVQEAARGKLRGEDCTIVGGGEVPDAAVELGHGRRSVVVGDVHEIECWECGYRTGGEGGGRRDEAQDGEEGESELHDLRVEVR